MPSPLYSRRHLPYGRASTVALIVLGLLAPCGATAQTGSDATAVLSLLRPEGILWALFEVGVAVVLLRAIRSITDSVASRFGNRRLLAQQISTVLRFVIYSVTAAIVLRTMFHLDRQALLALTGALAVAIGFGLKDVAASLLAGLIVLFDRPFQVGDRVTFGEHYGEVVSIGLRSVRLVTLDDSTVTIPNNKFLTEVVISGNAGALDMQVVTDFYIAADADLPVAKRIVEEAVRTSRFVYLAKPVVVLVSEVLQETYVATRLRAKAYVLDVRYEKIFQSDITERVKEGFAAADIAAPVRRSQLATIASAEAS